MESVPIDQGRSGGQTDFTPEGFVQSIFEQAGFVNERMEKASNLKEEGTKGFMLKNYTAAAELYRRAADLVSSTPLLDSDQKDMYVKCWSNAAMCHVKGESWQRCIYCCDNIIVKFPDEAKTNIKVLYRRGLAKMHLDELKGAKDDLMAAHGIDNKNKDVRRATKELKVKIADAKKKEKIQFGGAFGKITMYDDKTVNLVLVPTAKGDELTGFPDTVLATVAEFLTKTERALAAVAMSAPASSWRKSKWQKQPAEASKVMVSARPLNEIKISYSNPKWMEQRARQKSYEWDFVDFEDIGKNLAAKLTDDDIGGMLVCIDAVNSIKKLKLKGCVNVVGHGLEPLRGSIVLEQIDLSLVRSKGTCWNRSPILLPPPSISESAVIPILDSIVGHEGCALNHLQLPKKWRVGQSDLLSHFLAKYNRVLDNRGLICSYKHRYTEPPCGSTCRGSDETPWVHQSGEHCGIQLFTCYDCNKHFCEEHMDLMTPFVCETCEKVACNDCHRTTACDSCFQTTCWECTRIGFCGMCERDLCQDCSHVFWCDGCDEQYCEECSPFLICEGDCRKGNCAECAASDIGHDWCVKACSTCDVSFCVEHLAFEISVRGEEMFCEECNARALSEMVRVNKNILHHLHSWEELYGYEVRFESDLEINSVSKLLREHERMKQRWDHLYSKSTAEQRQMKNMLCIDHMFMA
ncbi:hypothetical protein ACHAXR_007591 [Thalassiosira sp. AJA248-18]